MFTTLLVRVVVLVLKESNDKFKVLVLVLGAQVLSFSLSVLVLVLDTQVLVLVLEEKSLVVSLFLVFFSWHILQSRFLRNQLLNTLHARFYYLTSAVIVCGKFPFHLSQVFCINLNAWNVHHICSSP